MSSITPAKIKPSLRDVADAAGVSRSAASLVLNDGDIRISDEKRKLIMDAARELGYRPHVGARRLSLQKTDTIGLVIPQDLSRLSQLYLFELTRHITEAAKYRNYDILLDFLHPAKPESPAADPTRVDGAVLISTRTAEDPSFNLIQENLPCVFIGGAFLDRPPENYVDFDIKTGTSEATRHLIGLGHTDIAFMAGIASPVKYSGYADAMKEAHLTPQKPRVTGPGDPDKETSRALEAVFNEHPNTSAIVAANDTLAIRLVKALTKKGMLIPNDVSVVGFDDIETSSLIMPSLTTVRIPMKELAVLTVNHLIDLIREKRTEPLHEILPTELILRDSTRSPRN
ncbi:MAG: LacI family transcriptional regulator [Verrucomicrobia bacterium]|nr:LacI family transcriptional regulator [Verrucomicrobiota bacterium]